MRSHRNENGHTLLVVPRDMISPFRNALQKLAGGIDFFALDPAERETLDQALRHLWNPGDDAQARDKTVPIDVIALNMREQRRLAEPPPSMQPADPLESPTIRRPGALAPVLTRLSTRERLHAEAQAKDRPSPPASPLATSEPTKPETTGDESRATVELTRAEVAAVERVAERFERNERNERSERPRGDGYRAPAKGRHSDVSR